MEKKFVRIQSKKTICVTGGLQAIDATNMSSPLADRLSVKPAWTDFSVLIKEGTGYYPAEIKEWNSVKSLEKCGVLTVGEESDTATPEEEAAKAKLDQAEAKYDADIAKNEAETGNKAAKAKKAAAKQE